EPGGERREQAERAVKLLLVAELGQLVSVRAWHGHGPPPMASAHSARPDKISMNGTPTRVKAPGHGLLCGGQAFSPGRGDAAGPAGREADSQDWPADGSARWVSAVCRDGRVRVRAGVFGGACAGFLSASRSPG